jgi:hypothetical protein
MFVRTTDVPLCGVGDHAQCTGTIKPLFGLEPRPGKCSCHAPERASTAKAAALPIGPETTPLWKYRWS